MISSRVTLNGLHESPDDKPSFFSMISKNNGVRKFLIYLSRINNKLNSIYLQSVYNLHINRHTRYNKCSSARGGQHCLQNHSLLFKIHLEIGNFEGELS